MYPNWVERLFHGSAEVGFFVPIIPYTLMSHSRKKMERNLMESIIYILRKEPGTCLENEIVEGAVPGKRARRIPCTTW